MYPCARHQHALREPRVAARPARSQRTRRTPIPDRAHRLADVHDFGHRIYNSNMLRSFGALLGPSEHAWLWTPGLRSGLFTHGISVLYPTHVSLAIEHAPFARLSTVGVAGCWQHAVFVYVVYIVLECSSACCFAGRPLGRSLYRSRVMFYVRARKLLLSMCVGCAYELPYARWLWV